MLYKMIMNKYSFILNKYTKRGMKTQKIWFLVLNIYPAVNVWLCVIPSC